MERTELQKAKSMKRKRKQSRKRKREQMMQGTNKKHSSDNGGIDKLSDDLLIGILSRLSIKEAARASVLARRWRHLWMFTCRTLRFDQRDTVKGNIMKWKKFASWVNKVVELYQGRFIFIEGLIISVQANGEPYHTSKRASCPVDNCVYFAMLKEVHKLEVNLSYSDRYEFPSVKRLISHGVASPLCRLRTLRLTYVDIKDNVLRYLLTSCANLEELCIHFSHITKNFRVIDPPSLRYLEISKCSRIENLEISAANLVSLAYEGGREISLLFKKVPVLRTLTIGGFLFLSFLLKPKEHRYPAQLEKLVLDFRCTDGGMSSAFLDLPQLYSLKRLDLRVITVPNQSLLFFTSLIKAFPQLCEFRIELSYRDDSGIRIGATPNFVHEELKSVEVAGYIGCVTGNELVSTLVKIGPWIERVVLDTSGDYFDPDTERDNYFAFGKRTKGPDTFMRIHGASTRKEAKERARNLVAKFPPHVQATVT